MNSRESDSKTAMLRFGVERLAESSASHISSSFASLASLRESFSFLSLHAYFNNTNSSAMVG